MAFLNSDDLITNNTGRKLFAAIREPPVVDPHNHANVKEIAKNANYPDAWQLFAATAHYVGRCCASTAFRSVSPATPRRRRSSSQWRRFSRELAGRTAYTGVKSFWNL